MVPLNVQFQIQENITLSQFMGHTLSFRDITGHQYNKYLSDKDTFYTNEFSCGKDNESDIAGHESAHSPVTPLQW